MNSHEIMRQVLSAVAALLMALVSGFAFVVVPSHLHVDGVAIAPDTEQSRTSVAQGTATEPREARVAPTGMTAEHG